MFKVDPALFSSAENNIILGMKELDNLKRNMNECALSFPDSYEFTKDINEVFLKICNLHFDSEELLNKVTFAKKKLCELDKGFALTYYACALQNYAEVSGELTVAQEEYIKYSQSQYYDSLYTMLEDNKDNLTPEQAEIYKALKEQKEIEKKYDDLQKLYQEKEDNNGFWHPIIESDINKKIANLEKELGIYENKWYEDIGQAFSKTGAEWSEGFSSLFAGEGFGELWDATKQTFATGAVVSRSVGSGFAKLGELIVVDGLSLVGGSLASGATWLFHDIWTDNDLADNVMDSTLDFVRRDLIGEANESFYENTSYGNWLNENSNLKYDSAGAKAIQTGSEFVGKIALATAATIFSGGMAAPIALGALYGTGKATERYTQSVDRSNGEEYSYDKALGKALAGAVGGSAEFYGYGRMGSAIYNGLSGLGSSATASASQASTSTLKNFKRNFFEVDTLLDSSAVVADHGVDFLTGDKSFDEMLKSGGTELLFALGLNAVGAGISAKLETKSALKLGESYLKPAGDLPESIKASDNGFKIAGDLDDISTPYVLNNTSKVMDSDSGLRMATDTDLEGVVFNNTTKTTNGFKVAGDLPESVKVSDKGFKMAGDLDDINTPYVINNTSKVMDSDSGLRMATDTDLEGVVFNNTTSSLKVYTDEDILKMKEYHISTSENGIQMPTIETFDKKMKMGKDLWPQKNADGSIAYLYGKGIGVELTLRGEVVGRVKNDVIFPYRSHSDFEIYNAKVNNYESIPESLNFKEVFGSEEIFPKTYTKGLKNLPSDLMDNTYEVVLYNGEEYLVPKLELLFLDKYIMQEATPRIMGSDAVLLAKQYDLDADLTIKYLDDYYISPKLSKLKVDSIDFYDTQITKLENLASNVQKEEFDELLNPDGVSTYIVEKISSFGNSNPNFAYSGVKSKYLPSDLEFEIKGNSLVLTEKSKIQIKHLIDEDLFNSQKTLEEFREEVRKVIVENSSKQANKVTDSSVNWFKKAGDIEDTNINKTVPANSGLRMATDTDLEGVAFTNSTKTTNGFKPAGDLPESIKTSENGLKIAGDLDDINTPYVINNTSKVMSSDSGLRMATDTDLEGVVFDNSSELVKGNDVIDTISNEIEIPEHISTRVEITDIPKDSLIKNLRSVDTTSKDIKVIQGYLDNKKLTDISGQKYLYGLASSDVDNFKNYNIATQEEFQTRVREFFDKASDILGVDKKSDFSSMIGINGFVKSDNLTYRISLQNSSNLTDKDILRFIEEFNNKAVNSSISYGLKVFPNDSDVIILYLNNDDLYVSTEILEELSKENLHINFGEQKPFTVGLNDDSYYGISMYATQNSRLSGTAQGRTMTEYSADLLDKAYNNLSVKYDGNISKITATEIYSEMHNIHNSNFSFSESENIPLWMNKKIYDKN